MRAAGREARRGTSESESGRPSDDRRTALTLVPVSRETERRFEIFVDLLSRWRRRHQSCVRIDLSVRLDAPHRRQRAASPARSRRDPLGRHGVGRGLPRDDCRHPARRHSRRRRPLRRQRSAPMRLSARGGARDRAPATVHPVRIETLTPEAVAGVDCVTARAFAPLPKTLEFATPWLESGAVGLFPRGKSAARDLQQDPPPQRYSIETIPSVGDASAAILRVRMR